MQRVGRMKKELQILGTNPPHGISCWPKNDSLDQLEAQILGPEGTPYEKGSFKIDIQIPERYPFEPPKMSFLTPIYHPNIDNAGRICLDSLKMPPKGAWKPALNISTVLTSIQLLMSEPNPEDPLMADISNEFKLNRSEFEKRAREWTNRYAVDTQSGAAKKQEPVKKQEPLSQSSSDDSSSSEDENCDTVTRTNPTTKKRLSEETTSVLRENVKRLK